MAEEMERGGAGEAGPRVFRDEQEQTWEVRAILPDDRERRSRFVRADHANGWLLFTLGLERRRLAPLPMGWHVASESQLKQWCADAQHVEPPASPPGDAGGPPTAIS